MTMTKVIVFNSYNLILFFLNLDRFTVTFPAVMDFTYGSSKPDTCTESPSDIITSNYINGEPVC